MPPYYFRGVFENHTIFDHDQAHGLGDEVLHPGNYDVEFFPLFP